MVSPRRKGASPTLLSRRKTKGSRRQIPTGKYKNCCEEKRPPFWTVYNSGLSVDTPKNCTPAEDSRKGFWSPMNRTYQGEREGNHGNISPGSNTVAAPYTPKIKCAVCPFHDRHAMIPVPWLRVSVTYSSSTDRGRISWLTALLSLDGQDTRQETPYIKTSILSLNRP